MKALNIQISAIIQETRVWLMINFSAAVSGEGYIQSRLFYTRVLLTLSEEGKLNFIEAYMLCDIFVRESL